MALVSAGMALAFTLGVPLGSIIGGAFGWRATFVFAGALLLLCAVADSALCAARAPDRRIRLGNAQDRA
jgi:predicted MFS family arabinose efflux permease